MKDTQQHITEEQAKTIEAIFKPFLKDGTVEIRQTKDGLLIYQLRRKEVLRLTCGQLAE